MNERYDYIIVGAGSAGCVMANRLSADPVVSVLLIESGPEHTSPLIALPEASASCSYPVIHIWDYTASRGEGMADELWMKAKPLAARVRSTVWFYVRRTGGLCAWEARGMHWLGLGRYGQAVRCAGGSSARQIAMARNGGR